MKTKIDALIVVEGKTDIDFLSSFIDSKFYKVNGSAVNKEDFDFINEVLKSTDVIVLTDPDYIGIQIRNKIKEHCPGVLDAFVRKEVSIKKGKVGVAESNKNEVILALKNVKNFNKKENLSSNLTYFDLLDLNLIGLKSTKNRNLITNYYHIGYSNGKNLLKKLQLIGINKEDLLKVLKNDK